MNRIAMILAVVILPAWVMPAPADGIFGLFGKKTKVNPAQRVPELIVALKTEQEERKRASAAAELGTFDGAAFPEIVPVLAEVLRSDPKTGVRMDAASSLGSIRPVSALAGQALEKAQSSDDSWRVRMHVKGILLKYRLAGYSPGAKDEQHAVGSGASAEPPLLGANGNLKPQSLPAGTPPPVQFPTTPNTVQAVKTSKSSDTPEFRPSIPRPLPAGPTFSTAIPQQTNQPAPTPLPMVDGDGPPLSPPPAGTPPAAPPVIGPPLNPPPAPPAATPPPPPF
jgi:hypothetical protein